LKRKLQMQQQASTFNVWQPKTYTWSGTFIIKDGRYTFTFYFDFWIEIDRSGLKAGQ
jgi:hypothetical protein